MASKEDLPTVTAFSKAFGAALGAVMEQRGVTQSAVARAMGKRAGASFVSERVRGLRAVDTDVIAGVAAVAGVAPQTIVREVLAKMRGGGAGGVTPIRPTEPSAPDAGTGRPPMYSFDDAEAARGEDTEKPRLGDE